MSQDFANFLDQGDPLVSVSITSYNKAHYLLECVESVVAQDYQNIEIQIVNDGSSDNTLEVASQLVKKHPQRKIKILDKPNGGASDARNYGHRHAAGRVVMTLDGDDKIKPTYISTAIRTMRQHGGNLFRSNQEVFGTRTENWAPAQYDPYFIRYDNCIPTPAILDKQLWEKCGGFKTALGYGEDWDFWVSISRLNPKVVTSDEYLTCYRENDEGIQALYIRDRWMDCAAVVIVNNQDLYSTDECIQSAAHIPKSDARGLGRIRELEKMYPHEWFLQFALGLVAEAEGRRDEALQRLSRSIDLTQGNEWQPLFQLAQIMDKAGELSNALGLYHRVRILRPDMSRFVNDRIKAGTST